MPNIKKKVFLEALKCYTLGWLINSEPSSPVESISAELQIEEGLEIHKRARALFEGGTLVEGNNVASAKQTATLLKKAEVPAIFEATFIVDNYIAKADIVSREPSGWRIFEVKSALNDKKEYVDDLAYTTMVTQRAGLEIVGCSLILLSKDYRLGMKDTRLFVKIDHTEDVMKQAKEFSGFWDSVLTIISQATKPSPTIKWECKACDNFTRCVGSGVQHPIFDLPRLGEKKCCELLASGVVEIGDMPSEFPLTPNQVKVRDAAQSGQIVVDQDGLREALEGMAFPVYNLDFETVRTAIPLYADIPPYAQIPTQYSVHICSAPGKIEKHLDYLGDPRNDPRRDLAERLINDCGKQGSIIAYTRFEKDRLKGLIEFLPDLATDLHALVERIIDLNAIVSKNYYHPDFHGSYSIKNVLPVLVPDLSYEDMDVSNGLDAAATFAYMAKGKFDEDETKEERKKLLEYCNLDTLAMVKLHECLMAFI